MTTTDLQNFFTQPYDQAAWLKTIHGIFPHTEIFAKPQADQYYPAGNS